jgi:hypothetical protein
MTKRLYQILILGAPTPAQVETLRQTVQKHVAAFGLRIDHEVVVATRIDLDFDETLTSAAAFFGAPGAAFPEHSELVRHGIPVVPLVSDLKSVAKELPECLRPINAMALTGADVELVRPAAALLQCVGLLPSQRRVFISYRREDSRDVAVQLFESLSARQFEVFLDTHSVGIAADFQSVLWHRMCDSDVVVMLDTPGYFDGRWTRQEFGRANDKQIAMLQMVWPGHAPSRFSRLAVPLALEVNDLHDGRLVSDAIERVALQVEVLRSKGAALRHASLSGCLRSAVEDLGGTVIGVGPRRSIALKLGSGASVLAYPTIGVPTAITVHEAADGGDPPDPRPAVLVYDHVGISEQWMLHLGWLGQAVPAVRWIKSREAVWGLSALKEA